MTKKQIEVKKIPSAINITINNTNNQEPRKRRKKRYINKTEDSITDSSKLKREFGSTGSGGNTSFSGTPFSLYSNSYRRPPMITYPIPPMPSTLPAPLALPAPPPQPLISDGMMSMMGNFGNKLLENFAPPRPYGGFARVRQMDDEDIIKNSSLPDDVKQKFFEEKDKKLEEESQQIQEEADADVAAFVGTEALAGITEEEKANITENKKYTTLYEKSVAFKPGVFKRNGTNDAKLKADSIDFKDPVYLFNKDYVESYKTKLSETITNLQTKLDTTSDTELRKQIRLNLKRGKKIMKNISNDQLRIEKLFN